MASVVLAFKFGSRIGSTDILLWLFLDSLISRFLGQILIMDSAGTCLTVSYHRCSKLGVLFLQLLLVNFTGFT